ncbi:MAG: HAD-IB family hydrolase [Acidobacteria bacterium]|nr:HAD-IB family hydrolase [Acidobacteriota bacterium]
MNLALFDFDGTITTGDTFTPFLRFAIGARRAVLGGLLISPVVIANRFRLISTTKTRPIVARAGFQGVAADTVRALGRRYATEVLPTLVEPKAMERLQWHRSQRDTVAIVSAGLDVYLQPWCEVHGVQLICSELEERDGRMTGRYRRGDCSGPTKARLIRATFDLAGFENVYAYGDTAEDREMLALANKKYYRWKEIDRYQHAG